MAYVFTTKPSAGAYTSESEPSAGSYIDASEPSAGSYSEDTEPSQTAATLTGMPMAAGFFLFLTYASTNGYQFDSQPTSNYTFDIEP